MIRMAITKGRIEKDVSELLQKAGIETKFIENKDRRLLVNYKTDEIEFECVFVKSNDVLTLLKYDKVDVGFVGKDTLDENEYKEYYDMLDLNVGKCFFALASNKEYKTKEFNGKKVIATKYPNVSKNFFKNKNEEVQIIKLEGSVEIGPVINMCDAIVDIVQTGETLRANGLEVIEKVGDISTRMVVNRESLKNTEKNSEIFKLLNKLENVI